MDNGEKPVGPWIDGGTYDGSIPRSTAPWNGLGVGDKFHMVIERAHWEHIATAAADPRFEVRTEMTIKRDTDIVIAEICAILSDCRIELKITEVRPK